jgi:2-polyprenyl-3-methyl-5-hydroxy-6-metoxy-1,4-benzoquinol methylase
MDCLRADHLGCYGYKLNTSPFIDNLAEESLKFNYAFSAASYTVPSITSMFTSKYPSSHSTKFNQKSPKINKDNEILIAEILKSKGYKTAAFVGALVLRKEIGLNVGFDIYDDRMTGAEVNRPSELIRHGKKTNEEVLKWLKDQSSTPFFLFVHYFDVHGSYMNQAPYDSVFGIDAYGKVPIMLNNVPEGVEGGIPDYQLLRVIKSEEGGVVEYEHDARYYFAQYDGGIRYLDDILKKLFIDIKNMGLYDNSLILLTADHGEAMGENNVWFFHSLTVTPDQIHVPLIIKPPHKWRLASQTIETHVSLIDLMPTILDLIDFMHEDLNLQGKSLVKLMSEGKDNELTHRTIMAEIEGQSAFISKQTLKLKPKQVDRKNLAFFYVPELCNQEATFHYRREVETATSLEWTGERYLPELGSPEISYEHWHRYLFARELVKNKIVLDIACGEGYGSYLLAGNAKKVIGVDIDKNTIEYATSKYNRDNLEFKTGLVEDIPINGSEVFDVIVTFETLEHIEEEQQKKFLAEVARLVNKKGVFIVSTPEKFAYSDERNFKNEFHKKEFYRDEFKAFLGDYFKNIVIFGQRIYPISYIWNITKPSRKFYEYNIIYDSMGFRPTNVDEKLPLYIIAACSNEKILINESSFSIDLTARLIKDRDNKISEQQNQINLCERKIQSIYSSRTWKLGRIVTAPWRLGKKLLMKKS